ncbi:hypothetical protein PR202_gb29845 [Eleusine coracana subsp. coracana]|uniref:glutaredoxin-dependent peroxiredoxin n=1 Tax=Eleusine coracana subsp. coracana TaxID=191504 RepID=A0AAV5FZX0_ELECO|nr:hypothetical protein PR202_gb29845 [Eleusine coracana subsp. coracana]
MLTKKWGMSAKSNQHVPGFITQAEQLKAKGVDEILLISVNDPFVMKAWAKTYPENKHVKFLADGVGAYTKALGLELDLTEKGLGVRSRRFALSSPTTSRSLLQTSRKVASSRSQALRRSSRLCKSARLFGIAAVLSCVLFSEFIYRAAFANNLSMDKI